MISRRTLLQTIGLLPALGFKSEAERQVNATVTDVKRFGAKGDGRADDTDAIQAAIDSLPTGGSILIPRGQYLLSDRRNTGQCLNIRHSVRLVGEGYDSVLQPMRSVTPDTNIVSFQPVGSADFAAVLALSIGDMSNGSRAGLHGVFLRTQSVGSALPKFTMRDCYVGQGRGAALCHLNGPGADPSNGLYAASIENNELKGGITLNGSGDSIRIQGNLIGGRGHGIYASLGAGSSLLSIRDNTIVSQDGAVVIDAGSRFLIEGNNIEQQIPGGSRGAMIDINGASRRMSGGYIAHNHLGAFTNSGITAAVRIRRCERATVQFNTFFPAWRDAHGIDIEDAVGTVVGPNIYGSGSRLRVRDNAEGTVGVRRTLRIVDGWRAGEEHPPFLVKNIDGTVEFFGTIRPNDNATSLVAQIDTGYRPSESVTLWLTAPAGGSPLRIVCEPNGVVRLVTPPLAPLSFQGLRYLTDSDHVSDD